MKRYQGHYPGHIREMFRDAILAYYEWNDRRTQDLLDRQAAESIATSHLFERSSVARELHAAAMLLRRGLGSVSVAEALDFSRQDGRFVRPFPESRFLTTREAM